MKNGEKIKMYKGFNKDMTCKGFKFKEGKTYEEPEAILCHKGFHACEDVIDCLSYYPPANSVYHEVFMEDVSLEQGIDSKRVAKKITIGKRLSLQEMIDVHKEVHKTDDVYPIYNSKIHSLDSYGCCDIGPNTVVKAENSCAIKAGSNCIVKTGNNCLVEGRYNDIVSAEDFSAVQITDSDGIVRTGYNSVAEVKRDGIAVAGSLGIAKAGTNGIAIIKGFDGSAEVGIKGIAISEKEAIAGSGGISISERASTVGECGISIAHGYNVKVRGKLGSLIIAVTRRGSLSAHGISSDITSFAAGIVDGTNIKADTWYECVDGKLVEAKEEIEDTQEKEC